MRKKLFQHVEKNSQPDVSQAPIDITPPTQEPPTVTKNSTKVGDIKLFDNPKTGKFPEQSQIKQTQPDISQYQPMQQKSPVPFPKNPSCPTAPRCLVRVAFRKSSPKMYDYLSNDEIKDLKVGDKVLVYIWHGKKRRIATVVYIGFPGETSPNAKSSILMRIDGEYMTSKYGRKYHHPLCKEMDDVKLSDAKWFKDEEDAEVQGYERCQKCDKK